MTNNLLVLKFAISAIFSCMLVFAYPAAAQSGLPGILTYIRVAGSSTEYVSINQGLTQVYSLPSNGCAAISPNGDYLAESTQQRSNLIIRDTATFSVILQTAYQADWETCGFIWQPDSSLSITKLGSPQEKLAYRISNGTLVPFTFQPNLPQYPDLPDWLRGTDAGYILPSPVANIYLYKRCPGRVTTRSGMNCAVDTDFVIYNFQQQAVLAILQYPNPTLIQRSFEPPFDSYGGAAWSFSGRYLAFASFANSRFNLSVYDTLTNQYLNTNFVDINIDWQKAIQWSPQGARLALWTIGAINDDTEPEPHLARSLVIFDADTGQFVASRTAFNIGLGLAELGLWSPTSQQYAAADDDGNLKYVNVVTREVTNLDIGVTRLISWRPAV
jgi:hypothetical protein